jgi:hypothetical protein
VAVGASARHYGGDGSSFPQVSSSWGIGHSLQVMKTHLPRNISGYVKKAIEHGPFTVDLHIKNGDFP